MISDARKATPKVDGDWLPLAKRIDGVETKEIRTAGSSRALVTEIFNVTWGMNIDVIKHIIQVEFPPHTINAWHKHDDQTDIVFCSKGHVTMALYDDREDSPTRGQVDVFALTEKRPCAVLIPARVWHGFKNHSNEHAVLIDYFDQPYRHDDPDDWQIPHDHPDIPYKFD